MTRLARLSCAIVAALLVAAGASAQGDATAPLTVVYVAGGDLWRWREGAAAQRLVEGGVIARTPVASPRGARVVFFRYADSFIVPWVVDADGQRARRLADVEAAPGEAQYADIDQIAWLDDDVLYYNTIREESGMAFPADDLWRVDVSTGEVRQLLAEGEGGRFTIAPGGERLTLSRPGVYGDADAPGGVSLVDPMGERRIDALTFPAVSTGSQYAFYAIPHWLPDGSAFRAAIPDPDAVYALGAPPPVALWEVSAEGAARRIGEAPADYFSVVFNAAFWSPDGGRIAYAQRLGAPEANVMTLCIAGGDGSGPVCHDEGAVGAYAPLGWKPDGSAFAYRIDTADAASMWMLTAGGARQPFPGEIALELTWVDNETYVYVASVEGAVALKTARLGGAPQTIAATPEWAAYSVVARSPRPSP